MDISRRVYRSRAFKRLNAAVMGVFARLVVLRARDDTGRSARASCLVLAPHPDDETLGCGATVARKLAAGARVHIVIATDGRGSHASKRITPDELAALRLEEAGNACRVLGVTPDACSFLGYVDGSLDANQTRLAGEIQTLIARFGPEEVLAPSAVDGHPDHRALNAAARRALAASEAPVALFEYAVWFWDFRSWVDRDAGPARQAVQALFRPWLALARCRPRTVIATPFLEQKRAALMAHHSQVANLTGEATWAVLEPRFLRHFFQPQEIFFAIEIER